MAYLVISIIAVLVSGLTLFSGFGLGTVLMPVFALFFPIPVAIAAMAVVHLANNIFKVFLVGKHADGSVILRFAVPGAVAAGVGAALLSLFSGIPPLRAYTFGGQTYQIMIAKPVVGALIIFVCVS